LGHRATATALPSKPPSQEGYALALIRQTHGAKPFSAEAWYHRDGRFERLVDERSCSVAELYRFLGEVVRQVASVGLAPEAIDLAFVLPASLLAEAFLRRCLRLDIDYPDAEQLSRIVSAHLEEATSKRSRP